MSSKDYVITSRKNSKDANIIELPSTSVRDPSAPTTSKNAGPSTTTTTAEVPLPPAEPKRKRCCPELRKYIYNRESGLYCGRSCKSWLYMVVYSIMYLIFLSTYTMIFLFLTLTIIKMTSVFKVIDKNEINSFTDSGIGLSATPISFIGDPLIWYTKGHSEQYKKYVNSIDELLTKRRKRESVRQNSVGADLGPCGKSPYGYGEKPCVIIRPNKQLHWTAKPFKMNSTDHIPKELQKWLKEKDQKLWLYCDGHHSYDKEHIGSIKYFPYPPGFDPTVFPLDMQSDAPLIAIQISNFTLGLSLTVECNLWYDSGISSVTFLLYVEPKSRSVMNNKV